MLRSVESFLQTCCQSFFFSWSTFTSTCFIFQWLLHSANHQGPQHCRHDAVSCVDPLSFILIFKHLTFWDCCVLCLWSHLVPLHPLQSHRHHDVLWSCGAGVSGDVPVCGLWREHHLYQRDDQGIQHPTSCWVTPPLSSSPVPPRAMEAGLRWCTVFFTSPPPAAVMISWCRLQYQHKKIPTTIRKLLCLMEALCF